VSSSCLSLSPAIFILSCSFPFRWSRVFSDIVSGGQVTKGVGMCKGYRRRLACGADSIVVEIMSFASMVVYGCIVGLVRLVVEGCSYRGT
jgi:hypothetical protein